MVDKDQGETRQAVVDTTKSGATMNPNEDVTFSIARDHVWAQNEGGSYLLGVQIPGASLPSGSLTADWVLCPFGEVRLVDYIELPEPRCAELMTFIRLREASRGVAATRWGLLRNVLKAYYAIPLSLGSERIWLRHSSEAEYVEHMSVTLRNCNVENSERGGRWLSVECWLELQEI